MQFCKISLVILSLVLSHALAAPQQQRSVEQAFRNASIVPNLIPVAPKELICVEYTTTDANGKNQTLSVHLGNIFTPAQVASQPTKVEFPTGQEAGNGMKPEFCKFLETMFRLFNQPMPSEFCQQKQEQLYTYMMVDQDGGPGIVLHYLVANIPSNGNVQNGTVLAQYWGPSPPAGESHRYVELVYKQQSKLNATEIEVPARLPFNFTGFVANNKLGNPIAGNSFMSKSEKRM